MRLCVLRLSEFLSLERHFDRQTILRKREGSILDSILWGHHRPPANHSRILYQQKKTGNYYFRITTPLSHKTSGSVVLILVLIKFFTSTYLYFVVKWCNKTKISSLASSFPGHEWTPLPNGMNVLGLGATCHILR